MRRHGDKDIRKAIAEAERLGWTTRSAAGSGHTWGWLECGRGCTLALHSTPRSPTVIARRIRENVRRCPHVPEAS